MTDILEPVTLVAIDGHSLNFNLRKKRLITFNQKERDYLKILAGPGYGLIILNWLSC